MTETPVTPQIGVLVPMRLETRFVKRGSAWFLRVRVVPDAVSITNHDDTPSKLELDAVEAMWRQVGSNNLESAKGRAAWRGLAALVGAEQAAWLARTFPPVKAANGTISIKRPPGQHRTVMHAPRLNGLPPTLELWLARGGQPAQPVAILAPVLSDIAVDLDDPDSTDQPWWTSFTEAVRVGMAKEVELGAVADDIDTLYLVGIGGGDPGALLAAQADSGRLGVIAPGSATNSVDGLPATTLGDVDDWRQLARARASQQAGGNAVRSALGAPSTLPAVVGGDHDHRGVNGSLVAALWPALWGHALGNVWAEGSRADTLGVWAADNLVPEGPLPTMRVDTQPYGILPATSLRRWQTANGDPAIEETLVPLVEALVTTWATTSERLAGAAANSPLDGLVRNPAAISYAWRWMLPTDLAAAVSFRYAAPIAKSDITSWWDQQAPPARLTPGTAPARRLVATGWARKVDLGLAEPKQLPDGVNLATGLTRLATAPVAELISAGTVDLDAHASPPWGRSLLTELARHAVLTSAATVARNVAAQPRALVEPLGADARTPTQVETWAARLQPADLKRRGDPAVTIHNNVRAALGALASHTLDDIECALRALLETATNRIDPWATAIAWRRLQSLATAPRTLGAYAWVDAPRPRGTTPAHQYVLAPSKDQASVAAMMRDRALANSPDSAQWQADLTSDAVRAALRLAAETREGSHPADSLGRMVERIVSRPTVIDRLREQFPTTTGFFAFTRASRIRRTCNGPAVLDAATANPASLQELGVTAAQVTALADLDAAVDALADLHLAEAALGVVKHRPALVSASSSAAAGESPPPQFTFPDTPTTGITVDSIAVVALPAAAAPTGRNPSPAAIADPAVAAYLDERTGPANGNRWTWTRLSADGQPTGPLTLADIGLRPCDTVGLGIGNLRDTLVAATGAAGLDPADPAGPAIVRTLVAALSGVPASPPDVGGGAESTSVANELAQRYASLRRAADAAVAAARAAAAGTDNRARRRELARLARWGITPMSADTGQATLVERVDGAAAVLDRRLSTMPATMTGAAVSELTDAINALIGPEAGYPVFARISRAAFTGVRAEPAGAGQAARLEPDWLETVAPVRPAIARLEAAQLTERVRSGGRPLRAWTNHPGDPWQTATATADSTGAGSRLVAVFGPSGVLPTRPAATTQGMVAAAVIDRFAETIPDTEHTASVAFPHDLPVARAPQAVLLAVPPDVTQPLDTPTLVDIVSEVRDLARARMTNAASVGTAANALHLAVIPAAGRTAVDLGGDR
jgi:hypothetical protein